MQNFSEARLLGIKTTTPREHEHEHEHEHEDYTENVKDPFDWQHYSYSDAI
jgi:hypothetical protein